MGGIVYRSRYRQGSYRGRSRRSNLSRSMSAVGVVPSGSYVPKCTFVKLLFVNDWVDTGNVSTTYNYYLSGNSIWVPDLSGSGLPPAGYNQWASFYSSYKVIASRIRVDATDSVSAASMVILPSTQQTPGTSTRLECAPYAKIRVVGVEQGKHETCRLMHYATTDRMYAGSLRGDSTLCSAFAASPLSEWRWILQFCSSQSGQNVRLKFKVSVEYTCMFFDPKNLAMS